MNATGFTAPHLVHSSVLFPPGKTSGDPEQGSEDRDRLPSKGRGVLPLSWDWGPFPEGALRTVFSEFSCKRPPTHAPQSFHRHLPSAPLGQLSRPRFTVPLEACGLEVMTPVVYSRRPLKRGTPRTTPGFRHTHPKASRYTHPKTCRHTHPKACVCLCRPLDHESQARSCCQAHFDWACPEVLQWMHVVCDSFFVVCVGSVGGLARCRLVGNEFLLIYFCE